MNPLIEQLENADLWRHGKVNTDKISKLSKHEITDFREEAAELTAIGDFSSSSHSPFIQVSSISLAGGRQPCAGYNCRAKKIRYLTNYAALYADRIYVDNLLTARRFPKAKEADAQRYFAEDLELLLGLRPLIEGGQIVPVTVDRTYCVHCLAKSAVDSNSSKKIDRAYRWLLDRYQREAHLKIEKSGRQLKLKIEGPEDLIEHGSSWVRLDGPLERVALRHLEHGGKLDQDLRLVDRRKLPFDNRQADQILENVAVELSVAAKLNASFVTERPIHISLLQQITGDNKLRKRNQFVERHLTALVPFVNELSSAELIKLRVEEGEAFERFRSSLNKSIDEYRKHGKAFTEEDAIALHADIIAPELARLDQKVNVARQKINKAGMAKIAAWAGAITFGSYLGFIPSELIAAAKVLGLTKVAADILEVFASRSTAQSEIANDDLYFLWRVKHLSTEDV